jgi:hypothetical protein
MHRVGDVIELRDGRKVVVAMDASVGGAVTVVVRDDPRMVAVMPATAIRTQKTTLPGT